MNLVRIVLRVVSLTALAVWAGGFLFYSGVVIPILHDAFGAAEVGEITAQVTDVLNAIGAVTVALLWCRVRWDRGGSATRLRVSRDVCLVATTCCLAALVVLHEAMERHLVMSGLRGFYRLHRVYLWISTLQWLANMALLSFVPFDGPVRTDDSCADAPG